MNARNTLTLRILCALLLAFVGLQSVSPAVPVLAAPATQNLVGFITADSTSNTVFVTTAAPEVYFQNGEGSNPRVNITIKTHNNVATISGFDLSKGFQLKNVNMTSKSSAWKTLPGDNTWAIPSGSNATADTAPVAQVVNVASNGDEYDLCEKGRWCEGGMWHVVPSTKMMYHTGGTSSIHVVFNEEAKSLLKAGYTAEFTMTKAFQVRACRSNWTGTDSNGNVMNPYTPAGCWDIAFRPGTYQVTGWAYDEYCKEQVGFRAIPEDAGPWDETRTCDNCVWPFPQATTQPTYRDATYTNTSPTTTVYVVTEDNNNCPVVAWWQPSPCKGLIRNFFAGFTQFIHDAVVALW